MKQTLRFRLAGKGGVLCAVALLHMLLPPSLAQASPLTVTGRVEIAERVMSIGAANSGIISQILVHEGEHVRATQILAKLDCPTIEADLRAQEAQVRAAQATADRYRNGSRPDEIGVGEAVVRYASARADEAVKALERAEAMQQGVTITAARLLEVKRDARIAAAQLEEARARLSLLHAGSREEDIRQSEALRDVAIAQLDATRARLDQCLIRAPVDGVVLDILTNPGQFLSVAVPQPLLHVLADDRSR
jgi:multidrug resistance efflux pump